MPILKQYKEMIVFPIRITENPGQLAKLAINITQKRITNQKEINSIEPASKQLIQFILKADHTSVVEHCSMTFFITNISRSLLAQITRHRIASYTAASQHYQDYRDYPCVVEEIDNNKLNYALKIASASYITLIEKYNVLPQEARQILPNASAVTLLWTVNARSLINFLTQRLCHRNVSEMQYFARRIYLYAKRWWPRLFIQVGPKCKTQLKCNQGKMSCGIPFPSTIDLLDFNNFKKHNF